MIPHARAEGLTFNPKITNSKVSIPRPKEENYKVVRAKEIAALAEKNGLKDSKELMVAHLLRECGSMTEECGWKPGKKSNDGGWAIGIAQWHLCYREWDWLYTKGWAYYDSRGIKQCRWNVDIKKVRAEFFKDRPEMKTWQTQKERYITEIRDCKAKGKTVTACIDSWNANPAYMSHVRAQLPNARKLLTTL